MHFKNDTFKIIRKSKKLTTEEVAAKAGIHRVTISNWERGKKFPSEKNVRLLAFVLEIPVSEISDLEDDHPVSDGDLSDMAESWQSFAGIQQFDITDNFQKCITQLQKQHKEFINASVVMNSLLSAMHTIFYVKDIRLKYITVNGSFLENVGLKTGFSVTGKDDSVFFPAREGKENSDEDINVIRTGKSVKREGYIPGSRKKKWGIIRKIPIFDTNNKIAGVIATFVDITERRRTEKQRRILESSINKTDDMFWVGRFANDKTKDLEYLFINDGVENVFGVTKDKYSDKLWKECLHRDSRHILDIDLREVNEFPFEFEYKIVRSDGRIRKLREKIYKSGDLYFGTDRDVTVYDEIQHIKEMFMTALDKVLDYHIWIVDFSEGVKRIIPTGTEYKAIDVYGHPIEEFARSEGDFWKKIVHPEDLDMLMSTFTEGPYPKTIKYRVIDKDGNIRLIQDHIIKKVIEGKVFFMGLAKNITEKSTNKN